MNNDPMVSSTVHLTTTQSGVETVNLSYQHCQAARLFARKCSEIETTAISQEGGWKDPRRESEMYAIGAVLSSVAALEASINELYLQAIDQSERTEVSKDGRLGSLSKPQMKLLGQLWPTIDKKRFAILDKYQITLTACGEDPLEKDREPFQSAATLIKLRNALTHFKPERSDKLNEHNRTSFKTSIS